MLNPIPIQFLALFAYFLLRLFIGVILIYLGLRHIRYFNELRHTCRLPWWPFGGFNTLILIVFEIGVAGFILLGAHTQYAVLLLGLFSVKMILFRTWIAHHSLPPRLFYVLLLGACLSLFITGAGAPAFDLPL